jgi:hypothetical protein
LDSMFFAARPVNYSKNMPRLFDEEFMSDTGGFGEVACQQRLDVGTRTRRRFRLPCLVSGVSLNKPTPIDARIVGDGRTKRKA